ncbi:MAG: hypothetical protein FJX80_14785 [Bacteroidetes bacterium]|nr:hypothetical protein [Bacteroidota bacterium]
MKGINHPIQIKEDLTVGKSLNFIYWLRCHLKSNGLQLEDLGTERINYCSQQKLWHWSADGAREMFRDRAIMAGFEKGLFSFHSLRSGFLCSALLKAGSATELDAVLEHTAFIAGWKVGGAA